MEKERNALFQKIQNLDNEFLNRAPAEGKWSINQILHHLITAESGTLAYIRKKTQSPEKLEKAGLKEWWKSKILNFYLRAPKKWKAPPQVAAIPDRIDKEEVVESYNMNRAKWQEFLNEMPEDWARKKIFRHPITGRMDLFMTLDFIELHARRHFGQIQSIVNLQLTNNSQSFRS